MMPTAHKMLSVHTNPTTQNISQTRKICYCDEPLSDSKYLVRIERWSLLRGCVNTVSSWRSGVYWTKVFISQFPNTTGSFNRIKAIEYCCVGSEDTIPVQDPICDIKVRRQPWNTTSISARVDLTQAFLTALTIMKSLWQNYRNRYCRLITSPGLRAIPYREWKEQWLGYRDALVE